MPSKISGRVSVE
ncbi:hypothetical protein EYZ11_002263 [Aspergillus tanneri]|uniref:Uncharacterized protein n=1 Tax=Aspergillus tanneri TaxID=1220188 RepID=A0A4S3JU48_9EURO|nr:hypothetical protein EYZ11_002263 [Aspergillus tanneri]